MIELPETEEEYTQFALANSGLPMPYFIHAIRNLIAVNKNTNKDALEIYLENRKAVNDWIRFTRVRFPHLYRIEYNDKGDEYSIYITGILILTGGTVFGEHRYVLDITSY